MNHTDRESEKKFVELQKKQLEHSIREEFLSFLETCRQKMKNDDLKWQMTEDVLEISRLLKNKDLLEMRKNILSQEIAEEGLPPLIEASKR